MESREQQSLSEVIESIASVHLMVLLQNESINNAVTIPYFLVCTLLIEMYIKEINCKSNNKMTQRMKLLAT